MSQQLIPNLAGGRSMACEVLLANSAVRSLIRDGKAEQILSTMQTNAGMGMITMNQALGDLYIQKKISFQEAMGHSRDPEKLNWMNGEYIRATSISRLTDLAMPFIEKAGIDVSGVSREQLEGIISLEQEKYKLLTEIPDLIRFFFEKPVFEQDALEKVFGKPEAKQALELMIDAYF